MYSKPFCGKCEDFRRLYSSPSFGLCVCPQRAQINMETKGRLPVRWEYDAPCSWFYSKRIGPDWEDKYFHKYWSAPDEDGVVEELEPPKGVQVVVLRFKAKHGIEPSSADKAPKGLRAAFLRLRAKRSAAPHAPKGRE